MAATKQATQVTQAQVDVIEDEVTMRYHRRRQFSAVVAEAIRRAETLSRLELQLAQPDDQ